MLETCTALTTIKNIVHVASCWLCLTLNLLMTTIVAPPSNASKWQMGFNSAFKGLRIFPYYLINGTIFEKELLKIKCVFSLSLQILSEIFLTLWRIRRVMIVNV